MNKINVDNGHINELKDAYTMYFNLFALFFKESCNSTVWTIGYVVPYHSALLFEQYKIGLGIISMQGKESKHSEIKQELKTGTNMSCELGENGKWHQLARSSYGRHFYLLYHFPVKTYNVHSRSRNPPVATSENVCGCFRTLVNCDDICSECVKSLEVVEDAKNGYLSEKLRTIILPIQCVL